VEGTSLDQDLSEAAGVTTGLHGELLASRRAWRKVRVTGWIEATVAYNANGLGYEEVVINETQRLQVPNHSLDPFYIQRVEFELEGPDGPVPAAIEGRAGLFFRLSGFRLTVAGETVYADGELAPPRAGLPLPARGPVPSSENLPRASDEAL
jgi:hypothetical protein